MFAKVQRCGAAAGAAARSHWTLNWRTVDIKFSLPKDSIAGKKKKRVTQQSLLKLEIWACVGGACVFFALSRGLCSSCCWFRLQKKKKEKSGFVWAGRIYVYIYVCA